MGLRTRLTLWYAGAFFAAGAVLITMVYLVVGDRLGSFSVNALLEEDTELPFPLDRQEIAEQFLGLQRRANEATMDSVLWWSVAALGVTGLFALAVGWLVAGRALRPIAEITGTARRVADRSLHERINLQGPNDEIKRLADTFDEMLARLDRAFEGQRRFVGNASHELRTPLAINRTLIEVAAAGPDADQRLKSLAENLLAVNARHERLIDGLLTLARADHEIPRRSRLDLADIAGHVADSLAGQAEAAEVAVRVEAAEAAVQGDAALLERLVENLIVNGIKHNRPGGEVDVATGEHRGRARLTVVNTGPVVAAYEVEALFEPFRRGADRDRVESGQGVGLGLSIVESVARAHGASVDAAAPSEGGLRITVEFPAPD